MSDVVLQFVAVQRWFGDRAILRGLSFEVARGQVYALLGRNGAGKTTALRILLGFLRQHRGTVTVLGDDSRALAPATRGRLGYVGEDHRLYPSMRVGDAVRFEALTRPGFRRDLVDRALQRCGLRPAHWIARLSRGQRATLSVVLAVAASPELLVCDDPALGLDVVMRREFLDALIDLLAETGCAVLFSSHFLTDVERIADRVGILHDGALIVDATLDDLRTRVSRVTLAPRAGVALPALPQVLRAAPLRGGYELTLLDADAALHARLAALGEVAPATTPSLEDLFFALTGPERVGLLREAAGEFASQPEESCEA